MVSAALTYRAELERLETQALALPRHSAGRIDAYVDAIALADAESDLRAGWWLRQQLTEAVYDTGRWDLLLPAFEWLLARTDEDGRRFPERNLLWTYKWVVRTALDLPDVSAEDIAGMLDDLETRFTRNDASPRTVHGQRAMAALELGDRSALPAHAEAFWTSPRDAHCDCAACEQEHRALFLDALGQAEFAQRERERLTESPYRCAYVPDGTYSQMLPRLWRKGRQREAEARDAEGLKRVAGRRRLVLAQARHAAYAAARGDHAETAERLAASWAAGRAQVTPGERLRYDGVARFALERLADQDAAVDLPATKANAPHGERPAWEVLEWLDAVALPIAQAFEARAPGCGAVERYLGHARAWGA